MIMWKKYFRFKLVPGVIITRQFGRVDFRDPNIPVEHIQRLYEDDFPYIEITDDGLRELYGIGAVVADPPTVTPKKTKKLKK